jgi:type I restriction enzyme S subunit
MTIDLRAYPEYKDSGVLWLGRIPAHWEVRASKRLFSQSGERARPEDEQLSATQAYGVILQSDFEERVGRKVVRIVSHLEKRKHVEPDDFVISMRSFQGGLERAFARGAIRSSYVVLKPVDDVHVPYFAHLFKSHPYIQALRATSEFIRDGQDLTFANFSRVPLPIVPPDEQTAIANFLDSNAVKVRRFIRNRRRLIEVLNEQKQAIVNEAVSRGLDPNARLKPSGIDWLGDVPEHWEVRNLRSLGRFSKGSGGSKDDDVPQGMPCIRYGHLYMYFDYTIESPRAFIDEKQAGSYGRSLYGDVLFTASGEDMAVIGKSAANLIEGQVCCGGDVIILRPRLPVVARFLGYATDSWSAASQKSQLGRGTTIKHIYEDQLKRVCIALPPLHEQSTIADHIEQLTSEIDTLIGRANDEIKLIQEYRTRLIADVVTGKVDVRGRSPEEPLLAHELTDESFQDEKMWDENEPQLVEEATDADD